MSQVAPFDQLQEMERMVDGVAGGPSGAEVVETRINKGRGATEDHGLGDAPLGSAAMAILEHARALKEARTLSDAGVKA